jgi:hypothetical protein
MACTVNDGIIVPDSATINDVVRRFEQDMNRNPDRKALFKQQPAAYLGTLGLNGDLQREILVDAGVNDVAGLLKACYITCICTSCCITSININVYKSATT